MTTRIAVDPDGLPVALVDIAGDQLDGTLWGAVRVGGIIALVVTEHDHFTHGPTGPPTAGQLRALADALDDDPNDPHLKVGSRRWEKERAEQAVAATRRQLDRVIELGERLTRHREMHEAQAATIREQRAELDQLRAQLQQARRPIFTLGRPR